MTEFQQALPLSYPNGSQIASSHELKELLSKHGDLQQLYPCHMYVSTVKAISSFLPQKEALHYKLLNFGHMELSFLHE